LINEEGHQAAKDAYFFTDATHKGFGYSNEGDGEELISVHYDCPLDLRPEEIPILWRTIPNQPEIIGTPSVKGAPDLSPQVLAASPELASCTGKFVYKALLYTRGSNSMINCRCLPKLAALSMVTPGRFATTAGTFESAAEVKIKGLCLPKFSFTWNCISLTFMSSTLPIVDTTSSSGAIYLDLHK
jgi:hypothetical protein